MSREKKKILLVTEYLDPPFDEGIKKTAHQVYLTLADKYEVRVLCRTGIPGDPQVIPVKANKLFISRKFRRLSREFAPGTIIYFPFASATFAGFLRAAVLKFSFRTARHLMIALQPKPLKGWQKGLISFLRPRYVLTPSPELQEELDRMQIRNQLIPLWTDLKKFRPLDRPSDRSALREKYGLPTDAFIISHMGHINEGRNLEALVPLQKDDVQVVVVESSSTPKDSMGPATLRKKLLDIGIRIISEYIKDIEEIYQLSDLYVFPVVQKTGSIGLPLSILEARACGIPVMTTDFGAVRTMLDDDHGNIFYSDPRDFKETLEKIRGMAGRKSISMKIGELNDGFFHAITQQIEDTH